MNGKAKDTKNRMTSKFLHYVYVVLTYIEKREEKQKPHLVSKPLKEIMTSVKQYMATSAESKTLYHF